MKRFLTAFVLIIATGAAIMVTFGIPTLGNPINAFKDLLDDLQPHPTSQPNALNKAGWQLVFNDEFEGDSLDRSKWNTEYWWGRINEPELQYYVDDAFMVSDGTLKIQADRRKVANKNYTSGVITSLDKFSFKYGYVEIRAKVPNGRGLWPAFWLLSTIRNDRNEIDVFEVIGHDPHTVYLTTHFRDNNGDPAFVQGKYRGHDFSEDFYTYAVEWTPTSIIWYVDGVERHRETVRVPQQSLYILANLAVGGKWPGNPDGKTQFPANYTIDYIRVYQRQP